ncbi:hypothetical protein JQC91_06590 [Jannaschia sp. Os4]|uniref:hypothetical protein n=1 Tax=Jannaschia sp. Os4 TaxID=2807617 RepID=UPI001939FBF7|nr:hypothetical protein [Jannaschia sp. Os4]MBM2575966.1 hypothetical protein [Jannaschia sp. Os4]
MSKAREERIKLVAGSLNTVGLAFVGFALVRPLVERTNVEIDALIYGGIAFALHGAAHYVLKRLDGAER